MVSGGKRILSETGMGSLKMFGPHSGRLQTSLQKAGIDPGSIDAIVCSHPHPDHIGGICAEDGVPLFPNAQVYMGENDFRFWTDERLLGTRLDQLVKTARNNLSCPASSSFSLQELLLSPVTLAGSRPDRLLQRWTGVLTRRTGDVHPRTHTGTCLLHGDIGEPDDVPHWRSRTPSCFAVGAATNRVHL
jgi:phosphoribosyl 1,2-cyclic phosphodiesterase